MAMEASQSPPPKDRARGGVFLSLPLIIVGAILFVVLGLGLGVGLGVGLRHRQSTYLPPSTPTPTATSVPTGAPLPGTTPTESWRLDTNKAYALNMSWDLNASPTTRYYDLVVTEGMGWPDGVVRPMFFINGQFPGPLIEANRGDTLIVNVTNKLTTNQTTMHWHGVFQNGTNWYDGSYGITHCGIPPNQSLVYNFTVDNQFGTFWYHSHVSTQYADGIVGPLIVHAPEEATARELYDEDRIILIQDWYHRLSGVDLVTYLAPDNENTEPIPDNGIYNGVGYFNCSNYGPDDGYTCYDNNTYNVFSFEPNTRTRLRFINTGSFTEFEMSVDNHTLSVIEADTTLVNPVSVHRLPIHVAQRYSAVLETNQSAATNYWLRAEMQTICFTGTNSVLNTTSFAVVSYSGNDAIMPAGGASVDWTDALDVHCQDLADSDLVPVVEKIPPPATRMWRIDFSFGIGAYQLDRALFNGTSWTALSNTTTLNQAQAGLNGQDSSANASVWNQDGRVGAFSSNQYVMGVSNEGGLDVVDILFYSLDEGSHPFHMHGHNFWILQSGQGVFDWTYYHENIYGSQNVTALSGLTRRDTFTIVSYSWTLIRFVADNPGLWAFHCHITWHMEAGLMMQFMVRPDDIREMQQPPEVAALCAASQ